MAYAFLQASNWTEIVGPFVIGEGEEATTHPAGWPDAATPDERAAVGIAEIAETDRPTDVIVTGSTIADVSGVPTRQWASTAVPLEEVKADATRQVNEAAGAFRLQFITDIPGQQATYLAKEQEALAYQATGTLDPNGYIAIEAAATGKTPGAVKTEILGSAAVWRPLDRKIEGARRGATVAIAAASNAASARAASVVDWAALLV